MKRSLVDYGLDTLKTLFGVGKKLVDGVSGRGDSRLGSDKDLLVQDPVCGVYIPKSQAVIARIAGNWHFFCSRECLVKYRLEQLQRD